MALRFRDCFAIVCEVSSNDKEHQHSVSNEGPPREPTDLLASRNSLTEG